MLDELSPAWWYEEAGRQAGPVSAAALRRMLAEGRISPADRVWRNGMAAWEPLGQVAELAPVVAAAASEGASARPPPLGPAPAGTAPLQATAVAAFEEIPVAATILLSVVTLGIYGLVKFHHTGKAYEQLAGRGSRFSLWFWLFLGLGVGGVVLNVGGGLGIPLGVASAVFQVLTLVEALALREEGLRRHGIAAPLTSATTHKVLLVLAIILSLAVVGLVLAAVQAAKWFSDWNAIALAVRGRRA